MAAAFSYTTPEHAPRPVVPVYLGSDGPYTVTIPKVLGVEFIYLKMQMLTEANQKRQAEVLWARTVERWLRTAFGKEQWAKVHARFIDPDDKLTTTHLEDLFFALLGRAHVERVAS